MDGGDALAEEIQEFGKCIRGEAAPETDGRAAREVVAILESIVESAKSGRVVDVSEIRGTIRVSRDSWEIGGVEVAAGSYEYVKIPVAQMLTGSETGLPLHCVRGGENRPHPLRSGRASTGMSRSRFARFRTCWRKSTARN